MSKFDNIIDNKIAQNLFIWFCLFLILIVTIQADSRIATSAFVILLLAPVVYLNNLYILPFLSKNRIKFILLFALNLIIFTGVVVFLISYFTELEFKWGMFVNFIGIMLLALVFASAIKLARDSFTRRQQEKEAELKLLKAQLNPHFLFNTLNNLYGLSVVKSDKLPNLMLKLSDLLRYSLYETKETLVPLAKEIQYLENYIGLEKLRLEKTTEISFEKQGNFESVEIAPMLLIVFVENAFKHLNISEEQKNSVLISVVIENDELVFNCANTYDPAMFSGANMEKGRSGIGLVNARKRLKLMYPERHELNITKDNETYNVALRLQL